MTIYNPIDSDNLSFSTYPLGKHRQLVDYIDINII